MKIINSADVYEDSGLKDLIYELKIKNFFQNKDYGNNEIELFFVINCLKFNVNNRTKFSNKDKVLYWDVILDFEEIREATTVQKKAILANAIINSFDIIDKYKKLNLNTIAIKKDATKYFNKLGWLK